MILEKCSVEELRALLPSYLRGTGRWPGTRKKIRCINPAHIDREPSMGYNPRTMRLHCFGCGKSYDLFDVVALDYPECSTFPAQVRKACELLGVSAPRPFDGFNGKQALRVSPHSVARKGDYTAFVEDSLLRYGAGGDYFTKRGIPQALCERHRLFERDGRAYLPVFQEGRCVAYCARAVDGRTPRYRNSPGEMAVFGLDSAGDGCGGDLVVAESIFDALSAEVCGVPSVALCGASNVKRFLEACRGNPALASRRMLLAGDCDEAGRRMNRSLRQGLEALGTSCAVIRLPKGAKDLNEALLLDKKALEDALRPKQVDFVVPNAASLLGALEGADGGFAGKGISTGLAGLDKLLGGGLHAGLYVLGAISSIGKTSLALQIADAIAESGRDVLYFTLEMGRMELIAKSVSRFSCQMDVTAGRAKALTMRQVLCGERMPLLDRALERYEGGPAQRMFFVEEAVSAAGIRESAERHGRLRGMAPVVIVDYLQILKPADGRATDKQNTDRAVVELKRLSRDLASPVLAISSFNRENYRNAVSMESFKESGAVEYSSDVLLGMQLAGAGEPRFDVNAAKLRTPRSVELVMLKNRAGDPYGVLPLRYLAKHSLFQE